MARPKHPVPQEESQPEQEGEWLLLHNDFSDLELLRTGLFTLAVPFDAPRDAKRRVLAAFTSYVWGNTSVDYALKRHGDLWEAARPSAEDRAIFEALSDAKNYVKRFASVIQSFKKATVSSGLVAAEASLVRLVASFQCCAFLIRAGYHFEAATICRLILEQLAWALAVHERSDDDIFEMQPNSCIGELKSIHPEAGQLYGQLSKLAHLHPDHQPDYLRLEGGQLAVLHTLQHARWTLVFVLMKLADWFRTCGEYMTFAYLTDPQCTRAKADGSPEILESRAFKRVIMDHVRKAKELGVRIEVDG